MENIKGKRAPRAGQQLGAKARFAVQGMNARGRYKTVEIFSELPEPSFNYCKAARRQAPCWAPRRPTLSLLVTPAACWRTKV